MPRTCTICKHPERQAIDVALLAKEPFRNIAERTGTSATALTRHNAEHLPMKVAQAHEAKEVSQADDLLSQARALHAKAMTLLASAEASGDIRTALAGVREARGCLEFEAKLRGELDERPQVNVWLPAPWPAIQSAIVQSLRSWPEARVAVADALGQLEAAQARLN